MDYYESIKRFEMLLEEERDSTNWSEMEKFFHKRTNRHIGLVGEYLRKVASLYPKHSKELKKRMSSHDASKFKEPEKSPYILLTWMYKMKGDGQEMELSDEERKMIHDVTFHHVKSNKHHPDYWDDKLRENPINFEDRDKPSGVVVSGLKMDEHSMIEMCCDWCAMSREKGGNPQKWASDNIGKRWKFSSEQESFIFETLNALWSDKTLKI